MQPRRATKNVRSLSSNLPLGTWTQQSTSFTIPANRFGRWLSSDWSAVPVAIPYANLTNPQTLNLYSMVADDPESFADLDGHCHVGGHSDPACPWFSGNDDQHLAAQQPQNTAYTATILGQKVRVIIIGGTADERSAIQGRLNAAFTDINGHAGDLSASAVDRKST